MEKVERQKTEFNQAIEFQILTKIYSFFEEKSKAELVMLSKKEIAKQVGISVVSLDKYLKNIIKVKK